MGLQRNRVRLEESRQELDQLARVFATWLKRRRDKDTKWQYRTQLASVEAVVDASLTSLRADLDGIPCDAPSGEVYERCRESDGRALFVRRFWSYFSERWDQRDDPALEDLLAAAEEIVWSCYVGPFRRADRPVGPAPLPFVDPQFSPHAIPRTRPPAEVKTTDDLLRDTLANLPVPVTGLPPVSVRRPWWLVLLAHETGHHVEFHLDDDLLGAVRDLVIDAARSGADGDEPDAGWARWSHELFADAFALASVGGSHLWSLEELELSSQGRMLADAGAYPPRAARGFFNQHVLAALTDADPAAMRSPTIEGTGGDADRVRRILAVVPGVARALVDEPLGGYGRLRDLADWRPGWFEAQGEVDRIKARLQGEATLITDSRLETARAIAAAAAAIGREIAAEPDAEKREARREHVAPRILKLMADSREPGDRATAKTAQTHVNELAVRVATDLRHVAVEAD